MPSTSIKRFAYDPKDRRLSVWFVASGRRYDYLEVDAEAYDGLRRAFAKGIYFNRNIRGRYVSVHVPEVSEGFDGGQQSRR